MRCARCNRQLKNPSDSGYGAKCETYVLGTKPPRVRLFDRRVKRSADERQSDLFEVRA